jgi:NlpC/P60 family putative phage cell wall peptidase
MRPADPAGVIAAARAWLGTPYRHQASTRGAGCDCLGLARGVWRALHGAEPGPIPPYTRDWGEAGGREVLAEAARRFLIELPLAEAGPGALILFRMGSPAPAKHCGILLGGIPAAFIHAYEGAGVVIHPWTGPWARRARFAFLFPASASYSGQG